MKRNAFLLAGTSFACLPRLAGAATLEEIVARFDAASSGKLAVYARALGQDDPLVAYRADDDFPSASTIKLLIMVTAYRLAESSKQAIFSQQVRMKREWFVGGSDLMDAVHPGESVSVGRLVFAMITVSDNTASNALIDVLGFDAINETAGMFGLSHTRLKRHFIDTAAIVRHIQNRTSAADMGRLVYKIEMGAHEGIDTVASAESCRKMIALMLRQEDRDKIPRALPPGTKIANKTGEIDGVRNDVAIVEPYGQRPYVIAVLSKELGNYSDGLRAIRLVAREVHRQVYG